MNYQFRAIVSFSNLGVRIAIINILPQKHANPGTSQCSKWYEISDMKFFQITEENPETKGLILIFYYQFNQVVLIKIEEITNTSSKFNKKYITKCKSIGSNIEDNIKSQKKSGGFSFAKAFWY